MVLVTFVPGLQGTDNRSCSITLLMPVQVDIVLPRALPDCYPSATVRHASTRESLTKLEEMRDFHMENAINSSMPEGKKEGGSEGGKEDFCRYK